jgi:hypothetical protein
MGYRSQLATVEAVQTPLEPLSQPTRAENQQITGTTTLEPADLELLQRMFELLDEWDRAAQNCSSDSEGQETAIASKPS